MNEDNRWALLLMLMGAVGSAVLLLRQQRIQKDLGSIRRRVRQHSVAHRQILDALEANHEAIVTLSFRVLPELPKNERVALYGRLAQSRDTLRSLRRREAVPAEVD